MVAASPYQTALNLGGTAPSYATNDRDRDRILSYFVYSDIYTNVDGAFTNVLRSDDDPKSRRYAAVARSIIEPTNRYLCRDIIWTAVIPPDVTISEDDRALTMSQLDALFTRETFPSKFASMKRWMLVKGDGLLQISADPLKAEGTRIRITEVEPDTYFPIHDPTDAERVVGVYLVTVLESPEGDAVARRMEYRRILTPEDVAAYGGAIGNIFYRVGFYELDGWDDRAEVGLSEADLSPLGLPAWVAPSEALDLEMAGFLLPTEITAIPVYHFRNRRRGNAPFGTSEIQGVESLLAGVTQNLSDEDTAVALAGIGVYWTDSGRPVDDNGSPVDWIVAPAEIIELAEGKKFGRVDGVTTVQPIQEHIAALKAEARESQGIPNVAVGKVDVQVAQSGIALAIEFDPMLAKNAETQTMAAGKLNQMMFDLLNGWLPAYESMGGNGLVVTASFGPALPPNRKEDIAEIVALKKEGIIDGAFARELLADRLGYSFPADMEARVAAEQAEALDAVGSRLDAEVEA